MAFSSFNKTFTGERLAPSTYIKGREVLGVSSALSFEASIHPLNGQEIKHLPEGRRDKEAYALLTTTILYADNPETKQPADMINAYGKKFEVISIGPWQNNILPHYRVIISLAKRK